MKPYSKRCMNRVEMIAYRIYMGRRLVEISSRFRLFRKSIKTKCT